MPIHWSQAKCLEACEVLVFISETNLFNGYQIEDYFHRFEILWQALKVTLVILRMPQKHCSSGRKQWCQ